MRVLVTGAAGMLGTDLLDALAAAGHDATGIDVAEADIADAAAIADAVAAARPDAVVNCAAYTNVDGAEEQEQLAEAINGRGAGNVAAAAAAAGARIVYVSTDYVFDGRKGAPYVESDEPSPLSAYGRTKLSGERATAAANERHQIARSSWLFGLRGRNFVETMLALAETRDEVRVVDDQVGCPTYTRHLAAALVELLDGEAWGVHHVAGGGSCSWCGFAAETFRQAGAACRALPATTEEIGRPAPRPALSALVSERAGSPRLPAWRDGLRDYLAERAAARGEATAAGEAARR